MHTIEWFQKLGFLGYPLLFSSLIAVALILERLIFYFTLKLPSDHDLKQLRDAAQNSRTLPESLKLKPKLEHLFQCLFAAQTDDKTRRDERLSLELSLYERHLFIHLRWLNLFAATAPLMGLLGTVIGMIAAFKVLAAHQGPVHPSLLADGLWSALLTTAAGLAIALPCLISAQALRIWGQSHLDHITSVLNDLSLIMDKPQPAAIAT